MNWFRWFWIAALLSNLAAAAQQLALVWYLSDNRLPGLVLALQQISGAAGTLLGAILGQWLGRLLGLRRTLLLSIGIQILGALSIGFLAEDTRHVPTNSSATALALVASIQPLGAGIGGAAWIMLVAHWPGSRARTEQLLRDTAQFQLGRAIGPLVGGVLIATSTLGLRWSAIANSATYAVVGVIVAIALREGPGSGELACQTRARAMPRRNWLRLRPLWAAAAIAASADPARTYLPRILRSLEHPPVLYSVCTSGGAIAAATVALVGGRLRLNDGRMGLVGVLGLGLGLAVWSLADQLGELSWVLGATILGASVSFGVAGVTSLTMASVHRSDRATATSILVGGRSVVASLVVAAVASATDVPSTQLFIVLALIALAGGVVLYVGGSDPSTSDDTN